MPRKAKRKTTTRRTKKNNSNASWDKIGSMVGKKIESECKDGKCSPLKHKVMCKECGCSGFLGRVLFAIFGLIALSQAGLVDGIATWVLVFLGIGFAFMKL